MGKPEHVPTFASYFPEVALEEFRQSQRRDGLFALRRLGESAEAVGRVIRIVSSADAVPELIASDERTFEHCTEIHRGHRCSPTHDHAGPHAVINCDPSQTSGSWHELLVLD
ncbi:MAG: hypothetical protein ABI591_30225 [Kofleriaceae bacterium]